MAERPAMSESRREQAAVARWKPGRRWYNPLVAALCIRLSRFIVGTLNPLTIEGLERLESLWERGGRGLLTYSNHVALFDDPIILSSFNLPPYDQLRWTATDALNFFDSPLKAWLFTTGRGVPVVRGSGAGVDQTGMQFLEDRLREGQWVHIFPEGGRTRDAKALMTHPFKPGIGRLIAGARPIALPFYHYGMHEVLPIGAKVPRRGKNIRVVFGEQIDCDDAYVRDSAAAAGDANLEGPALWEALATRAYDELRQLELAVNPAARSATPTAMTEAQAP